ncbi:TIGR00730 family Rossman fold protein [uncultured Culturomica sp.]|jgi:uncharacterized protein (TIGR00730 family)|uniref:LOG family protein n=1 Tax=uncultured Culturomica sp. TaxID=1926654 RepID=UPI00033F1174|nr:TIGR00730 family Rossman fold protein [uncultured Culturomica sp.]CCZ06220.1 putative uncharacterized protein [Odoribacter sp. CAG:788]
MNIAVFCASSNRVKGVYAEAARKLGREMAQRGWNLIYGGTNCGLMREVADAVLEQGGGVKGIIPRCIAERGVKAEKLTDLIVVPDMKERKYLMRKAADAFIALPGGWGTLEEITEVITLKQLGLHQKPIVFINTDGFYDLFFDFINKAFEESFVSSAYKGLYKVVDEVVEAVAYIADYKEEKMVSKY